MKHGEGSIIVAGLIAAFVHKRWYHRIGDLHAGPPPRGAVVDNSSQAMAHSNIGESACIGCHVWLTGLEQAQLAGCDVLLLIKQQLPGGCTSASSPALADSCSFPGSFTGSFSAAAQHLPGILCWIYRLAAAINACHACMSFMHGLGAHRHNEVCIS